MFILDTPNVAPESAPAMIAQVNQANKTKAISERMLGVCHVVPNYQPLPSPGGQGEYVIDPITQAKEYFNLFEHRIVAGSANSTILSTPRNGELAIDGGVYAYLPKAGFIGKDSATVLVEIGGYKVKVKYFFQAVNHELGNNGFEEACQKTGYRWKISRASDVLNEQASTEKVQLDASSLTSKISGIPVSFSMLAGTAVGETVGLGKAQ